LKLTVSRDAETLIPACSTPAEIEFVTLVVVSVEVSVEWEAPSVIVRFSLRLEEYMTQDPCGWPTATLQHSMLGLHTIPYFGFQQEKNPPVPVGMCTAPASLQ
jgi:hypothetical protein